MRAKLIFDAEITNPAIKTLEDKQRLRHLFLSGAISPDEYQSRSKVLAPAGTVIDHPEAWRLVGTLAEPDDQECIDRVGRQRLKKMAQSVAKYELLETAQLSGTGIDASPAAAEAFKKKRAERRSKLEESDKVVTPDA